MYDFVLSVGDWVFIEHSILQNSSLMFVWIISNNSIHFQGNQNPLQIFDCI